MSETRIAERAAGNGHAADAADQPGFAERLFGGVARAVQGRIPVADLDERDPDYIRDSLPRLWLLSSLYFRGEVRVLGNIPEQGPGLLVGNNRVDFGGRKGFIRLALEHDVPIVPVVSVGGQETALFLSRGDRLARLLGLDKLFRLKVLPISLALPWGLNVGDMLGHIPLPAKITVETLPPIDLREEFGPQPDLDEVYDHLMRLMQDTLDALAAERRLPVLG